MTNKTEVKEKIDNAISELEYVQLAVKSIKEVESGEIDVSIVMEYISDVKDSIVEIRDSFEEYDDEVSDIEDDLEGLIKRLSEVVK
ncbi:hypothetical protein [uncultured Clostridium sp.]|uniref:hypothetical protein n=1 Tax=uncultured Clostridium sp. TaxID=59620 RepID=UPI0025F9566D|nr:hypothetical protein [uncultured Clostridium sp.]